MQKKKVIVIGAGIGGIVTSIFLSQKGFKVTIFEKNAFPGGRCGNFIKDGHRFDIGATLLMIPKIYKETYSRMGKKMEEELELFRMDPIYQIRFFNGKKLRFTSDLSEMQNQLEDIETGSFYNYLRFMVKGYNTFKLSMDNIVDKNFYNLFDFINLKNLLILIKTKAFNNHYRYTSKYFKSEELRTTFTYQNIYVGQNPLEAAGIFVILPFLELTEGVWFPKGGMYRIVENFLSIAAENNIEIVYNSPVKEILTETNKVKGIVLKDDTYHEADIIISNADLPYVYNNLLPDNRYTRRINHMKYTCSALVFHWAMDTNFTQLSQHTVFVSENYKNSIHTVFNKHKIPQNPSFYLHSPVKSDPSAAPQGQDSISVIVPVPHSGHINENEIKEMQLVTKRSVIKRLQNEGLTDFEKHIKFERCYTQKSWKNIYNLTHGAIFGSLNHDIWQMGYFRPHNQHRCYRNLFFAGGSTHPGNGVPMALLSAKLTSEKVINQQETSKK